MKGRLQSLVVIQLGDSQRHVQSYLGRVNGLGEDVKLSADGLWKAVSGAGSDLPGIVKQRGWNELLSKGGSLATFYVGRSVVETQAGLSISTSLRD